VRVAYKSLLVHRRSGRDGLSRWQDQAQLQQATNEYIITVKGVQGGGGHREGGFRGGSALRTH
jgi:hypothetical protein